MLESLPISLLILLLLLLLVPILPNLWSIWHIFHCDFKTYAEKMLWLFVAIFLPVVGGLAYCFYGRNRATRIM
ncbi:MAG: PLDc N-terminal domain-containing protein [Thermodesulfobacteriota bacterium]